MKRSAWFILLFLALVIGLTGLIYQRLHEEKQTSKRGEKEIRPIPVEVTAIESGNIAYIRAFSGNLQAHAEFIPASKISGRVDQLQVDLADPVRRGQVVAYLDNAEYVQSVRQAQADVSVAKANLAEAQSLLKIADRELKRIDKLSQSGVSSESQRDSARAEQLVRQAHVEVTQAQLERAMAELESARIRLGYTEVKASWRDGSEQRLVAERLVDEGETVSANTPLMRIVELDPIKVEITVTERDYAALRNGQTAILQTDAYPEESFSGEITRISPMFEQNTRQARVELRVSNPLLKLKPGMFVRVLVELDRADNVQIVPDLALIKRDGQQGVFVLSPDKSTVNWRPVEVGIQQQNRIQIKGQELNGLVVTLGQQLLNDGSAIIINTDDKD